MTRREGPAIAAATAVAVAVASTAWVVAATPPPDRSGGAVDELELASGAIQFYEAKYAANGGHPTFGHRLLDFYSLRFGGRADPADLRRAEEIALEMGARARDASERSAASARLSGLLLARHDFEGALDEARTAVAADSTPPALGVLFDAATAIGQDALADSALARMAPGSVPWWIRLARVDRVQGRLDDALGHMGRAYRELYRSPAPRQTVAWAATMLAGIEHVRSGPEAAARWHRRALEISPGYRGALEGLADLAYARGDLERAESLYRRILADAHPDLYLRLAEVRRARGDAARARRWERRFLQVAGSPEMEPLYGQELAVFLARKPATRDRALEVARRVVARRPVVESREVLTWVHIQRAEWAKALAVSDRIRGSGGASATEEYHRARILEGMGHPARAASLYASSLEDPTLLAPHAIRDARSRGLLERSG